MNYLARICLGAFSFPLFLSYPTFFPLPSISFLFMAFFFLLLFFPPVLCSSLSEWLFLTTARLFLWLQEVCVPCRRKHRKVVKKKKKANSASANRSSEAFHLFSFP